MDEFVWILLLFGLWIVEIVGKAIKRRQSGSSIEESDSSVRDPRVAKRRLSREVTESARRAEDALARWEERQAEVAVAPEPTSRKRGRAPARKQSALEAIASMLIEIPLEDEGPAPIVQETVTAPAVARPWAAEHRRASEIPEEALPAPARVRPKPEGGLKKLGRLPELQRAIVLNEILGPPVSLARKSDFGSV